MRLVGALGPRDDRVELFRVLLLFFGKFQSQAFDLVVSGVIGDRLIELRRTLFVFACELKRMKRVEHVVERVLVGYFRGMTHLKSVDRISGSSTSVARSLIESRCSIEKWFMSRNSLATSRLL